VGVAAAILAGNGGGAHASGLTGGATARTTTTTAPPGPTLLVLGDSLTWGAQYFAKAREQIEADAQWEVVVMDGLFSRRLDVPAWSKWIRYSGIKVLRQWREQGVEPDALIVALGSNDVFHESSPKVYEQLMRVLLDEIGPRPTTFLTILRYDTPAIAARSRTFNAVLERVARDYPTVEVYDWYAVVSKRSKWRAWDKVHLTATGYAQRARTYRRLAAALWDRTYPPPVPETTVPPTAPTTTVAPVATVAPTTTLGG
jgi:lysophospholipase L1-like esterase